MKTIGIDYKGLNEEERTMQKLFIEEYRKKKKSLLDEVRKWREKHPESTLGEAIRALFELENKM